MSIIWAIPVVVGCVGAGLLAVMASILRKDVASLRDSLRVLRVDPPTDPRRRGHRPR